MSIRRVHNACDYHMIYDSVKVRQANDHYPTVIILNANLSVISCNIVTSCDSHITFSMEVLANAFAINLSCDTRKTTMWLLNRSDTNRAIQAKKMARGWKFLI